jgi:AraC-like DNA-binding protein
LLEALLMRITIRHATVTSGLMPYREILTPAKLRALIAFINQNLSSPLRLDDLAAAAALSRAHLARSFRNASGIPLHRYLLHRRLERARSLLSQAGARGPDRRRALRLCRRAASEQGLSKSLRHHARIHARLNNPDKAISSPITSPTNIHFCLGDAFGPLS